MYKIREHYMHLTALKIHIQFETQNVQYTSRAFTVGGFIPWSRWAIYFGDCERALGKIKKTAKPH